MKINGRAGEIGWVPVTLAERQFLPFGRARKFARNLELKSQNEWKQYCRSGRLPADIPRTPEGVYKVSNEWNGWGDWLGTTNIANQNRNYRGFADAKDFVRKLHLETGKEWISYCKSGKKPLDIPNAPWHVYKHQWKDLGDWLGTGHKAPKNRIFRPFRQAREYVRNLKLKSGQEWKLYCKSGKKPYDIPSNPDKTYSEWNGIGDWLGTDSIATFNKKFRPFKEARRFVQSLALRNYDGWKHYRNSKEKPYDIPSNPRDTYGRQFKGYGDWLGYWIYCSQK